MALRATRDTCNLDPLPDDEFGAHLQPEMGPPAAFSQFLFTPRVAPFPADAVPLAVSPALARIASNITDSAEGGVPGRSEQEFAERSPGTPSSACALHANGFVLVPPGAVRRY